MSTKLPDTQIISIFFFNRSKMQSTITKIVYNLVHHIIMITITKEKERREEKKDTTFLRSCLTSHSCILLTFLVLLSILSLLTFLLHLREERTQFTSTHKHRYNTRHENDWSRIKIIAPLYILCIITSSCATKFNIVFLLW